MAWVHWTTIIIACKLPRPGRCRTSRRTESIVPVGRKTTRPRSCPRRPAGWAGILPGIRCRSAVRRWSSRTRARCRPDWNRCAYRPPASGVVLPTGSPGNGWPRWRHGRGPRARPTRRGTCESDSCRWTGKSPTLCSPSPGGGSPVKRPSLRSPLSVSLSGRCSTRLCEQQSSYLFRRCVFFFPTFDVPVTARSRSPETTTAFFFLKLYFFREGINTNGVYETWQFSPRDFSDMSKTEG